MGANIKKINWIYKKFSHSCSKEGYTQAQISAEQAMIPLQGMADVKVCNEGNVCPSRMVSILIFSLLVIFLIFLLPWKLLTQLWRSIIIIFLIYLINTFCKEMAWLPFQLTAKSNLWKKFTTWKWFPICWCEVS